MDTRPIFDVKLGTQKDLVQFVYPSLIEARKFIERTGIYIINGIERCPMAKHLIVGEPNNSNKYEENQCQYIVRVPIQEYDQHSPGSYKPAATFQSHPNSRLTTKEIVFSQYDQAVRYSDELLRRGMRIKTASSVQLHTTDNLCVGERAGLFIISLDERPYHQLLASYDYFTQLKPYKELLAYENQLAAILFEFSQMKGFHETVSESANDIRNIYREWYFSNEKKMNEILTVLNESDVWYRNFKRSKESEEYLQAVRAFDLPGKMLKAGNEAHREYEQFLEQSVTVIVQQVITNNPLAYQTNGFFGQQPPFPQMQTQQPFLTYPSPAGY